jgi:rsbT antagonist protein RsbS
MMPDADHDLADTTAAEPLRVSILRQGGHLIASVHTALDDGQLLRFRGDLLEEIGRQRSRGVIIDVAALDVIDSFASHTLRTIAQAAQLRGARTVVVGIQPGVAVAMARLGTTLHPVSTALDLEEGIDLLDHDEGPDRFGLLGDADAVDPRW